MSRKKETEELKIDPRVQNIIDLQKKDKMKEKDKQARIYAAMNNLQVERK